MPVETSACKRIRELVDLNTLSSGNCFNVEAGLTARRFDPLAILGVLSESLDFKKKASNFGQLSSKV